MGKLISKDIVLTFFIFIIVLSFFQFRIPYIIDYDGYYHIKMAEIIKEKGFIKEFPWISESILNKNYADTQLLFRVLLIPFTFIGLTLGAKIAAIIFSALCFSVFYWFLKSNEVKYPFLWTSLLFTGSAELTYRFLLPRPMALSLALLILTVYVLFKERYVWLVPVSFLYVWLYPAFVFQATIVLVYFLIELILSKKLNWKVIIYPFIGIALGLIIHPYFYSNIEMLYLQLFKVNLTGNLFNEEWRPWGVRDFILNNGVFALFFLYGIFVNIKSKKLNKKHLFLLIVTVIFLVFAIKHRRMQEYFAPFSVIFLGFSLKKIELRNAKVLMTALVLILLVLNSIVLVNIIPKRNFVYKYSGCADWLQQNAEDGSLVFINGYTFNYLFFRNSDLRYTHGIDGTYSYLYNAKRFNDYIKLLQGKPLDRDIIKEDYRADYVLTGKIEADRNLNNFLVKNKKNYDLEYEDGECAVLKVKY